MEMSVVRGGKFVMRIEPKLFSKGLRPTENVPRNSDFAVTLVGAVGREGALRALEQLSTIDTSVITDKFPYPMVFVTSEFILVCSRTEIYELFGDVLQLKYTSTLPGIPWTLADFHDYILMTNGKDLVQRDATTGDWSAVVGQPHGICVLNFNGQVILGSPDCEPWRVWPVNLTEEFNLELTIQGNWGDLFKVHYVKHKAPRMQKVSQLMRVSGMHYMADPRWKMVK